MFDMSFWALVVSIVLIMVSFIYLLAQKNRKQLHNVFLINFILTLIISFGVLCQAIFKNINPIFFENIIYVGTCLLPVGIFFTGSIFVNTKIKFKKEYLLLFVIPILSLIVLWTNPYHNLFYIQYSTSFTDTIYGPYFYVHTIYSYVLMIIGIVRLLAYSVKNSGFFSRQSLLICLGLLCPITVNVLGSVLKAIPMTVFATPITFSFTILCFMFAILKFSFLSTTPIALQKVVDRMSDLYLVIDDDYRVIDFNKPFVMLTHQESSRLRHKDIVELLIKNNDFSFTENELLEAFKKVKSTPNKTVTFKKYSTSFNKYFNIEISSIISKKSFLGTLILFKDITQHELDMQTIKANQEILIEKERLATLGQMIGGIAHNLKTPIMSISGAREALQDLVREYDASIGDPDVNNDDHHEIARDMQEWLDKTKTHLAYMSDIITAVKGQAVNMSATTPTSFTVYEVLKQVDILMKHELKNALITLNVDCKVNDSTELYGNVNSLVQVINNIISNSIQSYNGRPNKSIDLIVYEDENSLIIAVKDCGSGMNKSVQQKLFNSMITTKGKKGTGLGLFMSYSNIKAHFNGDITFETEEGKGTTFFIHLPLAQK